MSKINGFDALLAQLVEEWEKCKGHVQKLEAEVAELKIKKARRSSRELLYYLLSSSMYPEPSDRQNSSLLQMEFKSYNGQDRMYEMLQSIADIHEDLRKRYWSALEQLAEQKLCWRYLVKRYRTILPSSSRSRQDFGDGESRRTAEAESRRPLDISRQALKEEDRSTRAKNIPSPLVRTEVNVTPHLTEIDEIPYTVRETPIGLSHYQEHGSTRAKNIPSPLVRTEVNVTPHLTEIDEIPYTVHETPHRFPITAKSILKQFRNGTSPNRVTKPSSPPKESSTSNRIPDGTAKYGGWKFTPSKTRVRAERVPPKQQIEEMATPKANEYRKNLGFTGLPSDTSLETDRECFKLKIKSLIAENKDKDDVIDSLQKQVKNKDAQINQLAKAVYVSGRIKKWK